MILCDITDWLALAGRLHPLVVHLPIGIILLAGLLEWVTLFKKHASFNQLLNIIWLCAALSAVFACMAGLILAQEGGYDEDALLKHQWLGIGVAAMSIFFYVLKQFALYQKHLHTTLAVVSVVVLSLAGHYGGTLTHGEAFLNEPLQAALGTQQETKKTSLVRKPIINIEDALAYQDLVEPVLEQKCSRCHNASKKKGDLRLDSYEHLLKGGKNGNTLVAGNPLKSELYKRLLLPLEDRHRMPPKGKTQLTEDEIALIHWWIKEANGSNEKKVAQLQQPEPIKVILAGFAKPGSGLPTVENESELPDIKINEATEANLKQLIDYGLSVNPLATGYPFLSVNCVNTENFNDKDVALLLNIKEQIVWLRMGNTKITDGSLSTLSKLTNLTRLSLEHTAITDKALSELQKLKSLQYLNLVNTKVSDAGIASLANCKKLKVIYLWRTAITPNGRITLKRALPQTEINFGE